MKFFGKFFDVLSGIIFLLSAVLAGILLIPKLFGIGNYVVISGSMEPVIKTGSVVYIDEKFPIEKIEQDSIIGYQLPDGTRVVHRAIEINNEEKYMITKGDANETEDLSPVSFSNVIGIKICSIPYLGYFLAWIRTRTGISICICVMVIFLSINLLQSSKKKVF